MKHSYNNRQQDLRDLILRYEVMSQKGTVSKLEETAYLRILDFYESKPFLDKAMETVDQAIAQYKYSGSLHMRKARLLLLNNEPDAALESLDRAEMFGQNIHAVEILRAKARALLGRLDEAMAMIHDLRRFCYLNSDELSELSFLQGWIFEKCENFESMFYSFKEALLENPNHQQALERIWIAVELCRKHDESIILHERILDENPYSYLAWFNLGHAHYSQNNYDDAIQAFEYAFIINDRFELAYRDYADLCFETGKYQQALDTFLEAISRFEIDSDTLAKIGQCYLKLGDTEKAKIYFFRNLSLDQRNDEVYFHIGQCYAVKGQWSNAVHFFKQAIRLNDEREDYFAELALVHIELDLPAKAIPLFRKAIELAPEQMAYWIDYAALYLRSDKLDQAWDIIEEAEMNTIGADLLYAKAACLFKMGKDKEAFEILTEALTDYFDEYELLFKWLPLLKNDPQIKAMIRYYRDE